MHRLLTLAILFAAPACTRGPDVMQPTPPNAPTVACIPVGTGVGGTPRPVGDREIDFRVGGRIFRSVLADGCPGLANRGPLQSIALEVRSGSQICAGDVFRVFDPQGVQAVGLAAYPICRLGRFVELPREPRR